MCVLFHLSLSLILAHFCSLSFLLEPAYNDFSGHADFLFVSSLNYHEHSRSNGKTINNNHQIQTCELVNQILRCFFFFSTLLFWTLVSGFLLFHCSVCDNMQPECVCSCCCCCSQFCFFGFNVSECAILCRCVFVLYLPHWDMWYFSKIDRDRLEPDNET